jgi:4-carboxymuconolactone decarboxylase
MNMRIRVATVSMLGALLGVSSGAAGQDRLPAIPPHELTPAQKEAAAQFEVIRGRDVFGPFVPLLRSPELMLRAASMGDYLRYKSALPSRLNEFVILITARRWTQHYEWSVHHPAAMKAGLRPEIADALAQGRRPDGLADDEAVVYDFCMELHLNRSVSDHTYARAVSLLGEQATVDMLGVSGYYTLLAMVLNTARTPAPPGTAPPLVPLPD